MSTKILSFLALLLMTAATSNVSAEEVTMKYSGETTSNMTGGNDAATVGLDATEWSVVGAKGAASNFPGLNKAGDIRLYYNKDGSNTITVSSTNYVINTIAITFTGDSNSNVTVTVNGAAVSATDGKYTINSNSFVLGNGYTVNSQVRIKEVVINYSAGAQTTYDINFNAANANTIEAGKATLTVAGKSATPTEGKVTGVKMGSEVKISTKKGYKIKSVEAKKAENVTQN